MWWAQVRGYNAGVLTFGIFLTFASLNTHIASHLAGWGCPAAVDACCWWTGRVRARRCRWWCCAHACGCSSRGWGRWWRHSAEPSGTARGSPLTPRSGIAAGGGNEREAKHRTSFVVYPHSKVLLPTSSLKTYFQHTSTMLTGWTGTWVSTGWLIAGRGSAIGTGAGAEGVGLLRASSCFFSQYVLFR